MKDVSFIEHERAFGGVMSLPSAQWHAVRERELLMQLVGAKQGAQSALAVANSSARMTKASVKTYNDFCC